MTALFSGTFLCVACDSRFGQIVPRAERDSPVPCPECGAPASPTIGAPMVARASHPDGTRRHDLRRLSEASQIEAASFDVAPDKRGDYDKAIKELTKSGSKT